MAFNLYQPGPLANKVIGLISCGDAKRKHACSARNIYTSPLLKVGTKWLDHNCATWYIVSAKYGLLEPDRVIEPYNTYLPDLTDKRRLAWAQKVREGLCGLSVPILFIGGVFYLETINEDAQAPIPVIGLFQQLGIGNRGKRVQWLKNNPVLTPKLLKELTVGKP